MSDETQQFLQEAIEKSSDALNRCAQIFAQMARRGQYPQELQGCGWEFAVQARDSLKAAAKRAGLSDGEIGIEDPGFTFGGSGLK